MTWVKAFRTHLSCRFRSLERVPIHRAVLYAQSHRTGRSPSTALAVAAGEKHWRSDFVKICDTSGAFVRVVVADALFCVL